MKNDVFHVMYRRYIAYKISNIFIYFLSYFHFSLKLSQIFLLGERNVESNGEYNSGRKGVVPAMGDSRQQKYCACVGRLTQLQTPTRPLI